MARDYTRGRSTRQKSSSAKQLFWLLASFLCGYLAATIFDFTSLSSWINANILAKQDREKPTVQVAKKDPELPKPKFEFYTLLAKDRSAEVKPVSKPKEVIQAKPLGQPSVVEANPGKESYLIQLAAFKNKQDAEQMKAELTLKGFEVSVVATSQQQVNWYRVIAGPFSNRVKAEKAQVTLAQNEGIKGIVRRVG